MFKFYKFVFNNDGKYYTGNSAMDDNWPAAAYQDSYVGRGKNQGRFGNSDSLNNPAAMSGEAQSLVDASVNASGTVQNTVYTLNSFLLPALAFLKTGRSLSVRFWGTTAANANAKDILINFGATTVLSVVGSVINAGFYKGSLTVTRLSQNLFSAVAELEIGSGNVNAIGVNAAIAQSEIAAITISVQSRNTAAAAASATGQGMVGTFLN